MYLQEYVKKVIGRLEANNPDRLSDFKKNAQAAVKKVSLLCATPSWGVIQILEHQLCFTV